MAASGPHFTSHVEVGGLIYLSGQLPFDAEGKMVDDGIENQTDRVLRNIEALLAGEGLDRTSIFKATIWLTDAADFRGFNEAYAAFFGDHKPVRSTVVSPLVVPGARIEIEVVATRA